MAEPEPKKPSIVFKKPAQLQAAADETAAKPTKIVLKKKTVVPAASVGAGAGGAQPQGPRQPRDALQIRAQGLYNKVDMRVFYDKKGNLDIRTKGGKYVDHVVMPTYRPITDEELLEMDQARIGRVEEAEAKIEKLLPELRELITRYRSFKDAKGEDSALLEPVALSEVLLINQQLDDAYKEYTSGLYAERVAQSEERLQIRNIHYDDPKNEKAAGTVWRVRTRRLPLSQSTVRSAPPEADEEIPEAVRAEAAREVPGERYTIFSDPSETNGVFSPEAPANFNWNGTEYMSLRQAIEAERARAMGNAGLVQTILKAPTSASVRSIAVRASTKEGTEGLKISEEELTNIVRASFADNPDRAKILQNTGATTLVYADQTDKTLGVGRDAQHAQRQQWQGQNLYGKALENVRSELLATKQQQLAAIAEEAPEDVAAAASAAASVRAKTVGGIIAGKKVVLKKPTMGGPY
jgi:ribA/ribD-fused uncharacterized protein